MADITLTLTKEEAFTLRMVMDRIAGDFFTSRREHTNSIGAQLSMAGIEYDDELSDRIMHGHITFTG